MSRRTTRVVLVSTVLTLITVRLPAQQLVFRGAAEYVPIDVIVTDNHDKTVTDLTKDDFEITESKHSQTIADFKFVTVPPTRRTVIDPGHTVVTIDVTTNQVPPKSRAFVVVIDDLHLLPQHLVPIKGVVTDILTSMAPTDRVAVVFTGRSDLSIDFTTDINRQMLAVGRIKSALGFAQDPSPVFTGPDEQMRRHFALGTLDVIRNTVSALAASKAERRSVIWVSEGFNYDFDAQPLEPHKVALSAPDVGRVPQSTSSMPGNPPENVLDARDVFDQLKLLYETAQRADVPISTIDPRGTEGPDEAVIGWSPGGTLQQIQSKMFIQDNFMRNVAEQTGGISQVRNSDLVRGVHDIIEDNSSYYLLGYYPEPLVRDGKYHQIDVKVKRPGLHVRARNGYIAPVANVKAATATALLDTALGAAVSVDGLQLRAVAEPVIAATPKGMTAVVTVEVTYPLTGAHVDDELQFAMLALDVEGKPKAQSRNAFHFTASPRGPGESTFLINQSIDLPSEPVFLRVGVSSRALGKTGTVHIPLEIPNPSDDALFMGGVVIGLAGAAPQPAMPPNALKDLVPFQPTTTRVFAASDALRVFVPVFWGSKEPSVDVALAILGEHVTPARSETVTATASTNGHHRGALDTTLSLNDLAPGAYTLEVVARLPNGQTTRRDVAFERK
jgi:VWFA-related protein